MDYHYQENSNLKQIIVYILIFPIYLLAIDFKTVEVGTVSIDSNLSLHLVLQEEKTKGLASIPAKVLLKYTKNNLVEQRIFQDNTEHFPILYFSSMSINTKKNDIVNLKDSINIFDITGDKRNEILIYGTSHYGGSGFTGNVMIISPTNKDDFEELGIIRANDNFDIQYISEENIIIVAQYIWRSGIEGHYGDKHKYEYYIYEIDNNLTKLPILLTTKKYYDINNTFVMHDNLDKILKKYKIYKQGRLSKEEIQKWKKFVMFYWEKISQKDFTYLNKVYADRVFYYHNIDTKANVLKDKKRLLSKIQTITFNLNNFLIYKSGNIIIIEYIKAYDIDDGKDYGKVKSTMKIQKIKENYKIIDETDEAILNLKRDID